MPRSATTCCTRCCSLATKSSSSAPGLHERRPVVALDVLRHSRRLEHLRHPAGDPLALGVGEPRRRDEHAPVGELEVDALVLDRRRLAPVDLDVDGRGHREQPHLARLDLVDELAQPGDARVDRAGQDRRVRLAAARVRDVLGLLRVGARARARARPPAAGRSSPPSRPPSGSSPGRALKSSVRSLSDRYLEFAGTTIPSVSVIIVAIGVVRLSGTSDPLVSIAPSITSPVIISWYGSPRVLRDQLREPERPARALDVVDLDAVVELRRRATRPGTRARSCPSRRPARRAP